MKFVLYLFCWVMLMSGMAACKQEIDQGNLNGVIGQKPGEFSRALKQKSTGNKRTEAKTKTIPRQNLHESRFAPLPDVDTEEAARQLVEALAAQKVKEAEPFLINFKVMSKLRKMHMSSAAKEKRIINAMVRGKKTRIYRKLRTACKNDKFKEATFESIVLGKCSWVKPENSWNQLGYWRCLNNRVYYHQQGNRKYLQINQMINWGKRWYITSF
ncbi:MAG: hypothetical protein PF689_09510 [Deltaproteobacteria bacterium]|nr:hypothetical protein [Deltaproteobacteria bacterium]